MPEAVAALKDPLIYAFIAWMAKEIYAIWTDQRKGLKAQVRQLQIELRQFELTLTRLDERLKPAIETATELPKLKRDLDLAHHHLRIVRPELYSPPSR